MITKLLRKMADRPARMERRRRRESLESLVPLNPSSDDTYIVAFAKSGGTWFSFLLANVNLLINQMPQTATWWNIRDYIFDIHESRHMPPSPFSHPRGRFIHTHSEFNPRYLRVLYLIRDPRDALVSYYDLTTKFGWFKGTMDEFLDSPKFGIAAWVRHVGSWVHQHTDLNRIHFVRYEDLKSEPLEVLDRIYRLYGQEVPPEMLKKAVQRSSFESMRKSEADYRKYSYDLGSTFVFVRKGRAGGFGEELTPAQIARIETECAEWMKMFNYLPPDKGATSPNDKA